MPPLYPGRKIFCFDCGYTLACLSACPYAVFKKLIMLLLPYLNKYDYVRSVDRVDGNVTTMAAPRSDLYAPDLYVPLLAMFTYVILAACNKFATGLFTPEVIHSMVCSLSYTIFMLCCVSHAHA